jgi:hypothetical protein
LGANPLIDQAYTLRIFDERGWTVGAVPRLLNPNPNLGFAMYSPAAYTPIECKPLQPMHSTRTDSYRSQMEVRDVQCCHTQCFGSFVHGTWNDHDRHVDLWSRSVEGANQELVSGAAWNVPIDSN